jgi:hypothetical protein
VEQHFVDIKLPTAELPTAPRKSVARKIVACQIVARKIVAQKLLPMANCRPHKNVAQYFYAPGPDVFTSGLFLRLKSVYPRF